MSNKSPVFPMPTGAKSQHFSGDYGFDPQIDYFQVLEESKMRKRDNNDDNHLSVARSVDSLHFKLQKPISKDESKKQKKTKWWRNAMLFLRKRLVQGSQPHDPREDRITGGEMEQIRCRGPYVGSLSSPLYLTESRSGSSTPYRSRSGPASTPARRIGDVEIPYISLRELNMEAHDHEMYKGTTNSAMPIYLVT